MEKPIDRLEPKDALPLLIRLRRKIMGNKKPDGFTRLVFFLSMLAWVLLAFWNAISYFVLLSADMIEKNKGLPVKEILIKNGQKLGFQGEEFIPIIHQFYFVSNFFWLLILLGLILMYRKKIIYIWIVFLSFILYFSYTAYTLGFSYLWTDISFFDKILWLILIVLLSIHALLMRKENKGELQKNQSNKND